MVLSICQGYATIHQPFGSFDSIAPESGGSFAFESDFD